MVIFIDYSVSEDCINDYSFGEICVKCNACGRFDMRTQRKDAIRMWKQQLEELQEESAQIQGMIYDNNQAKNILSRITYIQKKIKELENYDRGY